MKRVIDTTETLGTVDLPEGKSELCAAAVARFDEGKGRLQVELSSFLRPTDLLAKERHFRTEWLPRDESVTESVGPEECHEMAREIFQRWTRKVRESSRQLHPV